MFGDQVAVSGGDERCFSDHMLKQQRGEKCFEEPVLRTRGDEFLATTW